MATYLLPFATTSHALVPVFVIFVIIFVVLVFFLITLTLILILFFLVPSSPILVVFAAAAMTRPSVFLFLLSVLA